MRAQAICGLVATAMLATACGADFESISRRTPLPKSNDGGIAVHLDAQQRLVLYSAKKYCAEPSPDALAAYAQSIGLGKGDPGQDALSLTAASESTLASIGLRTQSITIMRDALYRMCEAYNNNALGEVMVATLLGRSQDLTAVILAVEQLTGAVAANQVVVTHTAGANASANLVANEQALAAAQETVKKRETSVEAAAQNLKDAEEALGVAKTNEEAAQRALTEANHLAEHDQTKEDRVRNAKSEHNGTTEALQEAEEIHKRATADFQAKRDQLEIAKQVMQTIEAGMDAALTYASSSTSGSGQFSPVQQRYQLSDAATQAIASAVKDMVKEVLSKSYTTDSCIAFLTSSSRIVPPAPVQSNHNSLKHVEELCIQLAQTGIQAEIIRLSSNYKPSDESRCIRHEIKKDPTFRQKFRDWLKGKNISASVGYVIDSRDFQALRKNAVRELNLSCT